MEISLVWKVQMNRTLGLNRLLIAYQSNLFLLQKKKKETEVQRLVSNKQKYTPSANNQNTPAQP